MGDQPVIILSNITDLLPEAFTGDYTSVYCDDHFLKYLY